jgi:hypothetical protein
LESQGRSRSSFQSRYGMCQRSHRDRIHQTRSTALSHDERNIRRTPQTWWAADQTIEWDDPKLGRLRQPWSRQKIFNEQQEGEIKKKVEAEPKNLNSVQNEIEKRWGVKVSKDTIKRILKNKKMRWKRMRRVPGDKPDEKLYKRKVKALAQLKRL